MKFDPNNPEQKSSSESDERLKKLESWVSLFKTPAGMAALVALMGMVFNGYQQYQAGQGKAVDPAVSALVEAIKGKGPTEPKPPATTDADTKKRIEAIEKALQILLEKREQKTDEVCWIPPPLPAEPPAPPDPLLAAWTLAAKEKKPLVIFVDLPARTIPGCRSVALPSLNGKSAKTVHVLVDPRADSGVTLMLPADATDSQIRQAAGLEASPTATPFRSIQSRSANC